MKLTMQIDTADKQNLQEAMLLLQTFLNFAGTETAAAPVKPIKKTAAKTEAKQPVKKTAAKTEAKQPVKKTAAKTEPSKDGIKIEDIRNEVRDLAKLAGNKDKIIAKLEELGADSVTKLDVSKYGDMMAFLKTLK